MNEEWSVGLVNDSAENAIKDSSGAAAALKFWLKLKGKLIMENKTCGSCAYLNSFFGVCMLQNTPVSGLSSICSRYQESRLYCSNNTNFGAIEKGNVKKNEKFEQ